MTVDEIVGFSRAMFGQWFYYKPARVLLDAGEGVGQTLRKRIGGIRHVFLSHGHIDHACGLVPMVGLRIRLFGREGLPGPLVVHYPADDPLMGLLRSYIEVRFAPVGPKTPPLAEVMTWNPLQAGDHVELESKRPKRVIAFPAEHTVRWQSLGYRIEELRWVLKPEFEGHRPDEVKALVESEGRDAVLEQRWHPELVYTGDSRPPPDLEIVRGADLLLIDSTFLEGDDVEDDRHGRVDTSFRVAAEAGVRHLVLMHLSARYHIDEIIAAARTAGERHGWPARCSLFLDHQCLPLER